MTGTVLDRILEAKRARLRAGEFRPEGSPASPSDGGRFEAALRSAPAVIAEIKHRSPSAGEILPGAAARVEEVAAAYRRGGAAALSIVIEQDFFGGDPSWLPRAKRASGLPVLMKDFVVDERQVDFARSIGADAILLIVSALAQEELVRLHRRALDSGLAVLVEAHDEEEARRAAAAGARIVGVNARDLRTFRVDLERMARTGDALPAEAVRVAESGIRTAADVKRLRAAGYSAFLVGESLLRSGDGARGVRALRGEGTAEVKVCGITREEDLETCREAGVDHVGLNFSPLSPRRLSLEAGSRLRAAAAGFSRVVAVFAGNPAAEIEEAARVVRPDVLQLHDAPGPEPRSWPLPVWQTVHVTDRLVVPDWPAERLLFDTGGKRLPGGTGETFDWGHFRGARPGRPFLLAGGLGPENVGEAVRLVRPDGVDVASGVESAPGIKDREMIGRFVRAVRSVEDALSEEQR
jgi:indole-3-glycerol phosphate synthase / phosphoribosylanthranilate isomerase